MDSDTHGGIVPGCPCFHLGLLPLKREGIFFCEIGGVDVRIIKLVLRIFVCSIFWWRFSFLDSLEGMERRFICFLPYCFACLSVLAGNLRGEERGEGGER
ncbi:hypothetical protein DL95DRAFT_142895 [Leptodontidium sp. 2 PMI_412]|nr:hypothetical protein DL95DRAFT_142895 [Leptodontidium sp. 2 PMI_412]